MNPIMNNIITNILSPMNAKNIRDPKDNKIKNILLDILYFAATRDIKITNAKVNRFCVPKK